MNPANSGAQPELSVAKVLQVFLSEYRQRFSLPVHQLKVLGRLADCRSGRLGWTVWQCEPCQKSLWQPNGCGDRHCPACQYQRTAQWLENQRAALLAVRYFHLVFTLPALLRALALQNPIALYGLLFEAASATLLQFGQERFKAQLGLTAVLHTWGQNQVHHPHLHCLVPGGGLTTQNSWAGPKQTRWLFDVHALAAMFEGKFCAGLLRLQATGKLQFHGQCQQLQKPAAFAALLRQLHSQRWVVFAKGSVRGATAVLEYLGRYAHRVAISNRRLLAIDAVARTVTFSYKDYADAHRIKPITLSGVEFIRRFLFHVLPCGFTKIRHYGFLGNSQRQARLPLARAALEKSPLRFDPPAQVPAATPSPRKGLCCPQCQGQKFRCLGRMDRSGKWTVFGLPFVSNAARPWLDSS